MEREGGREGRRERQRKKVGPKRLGESDSISALLGSFPECYLGKAPVQTPLPRGLELSPRKDLFLFSFFCQYTRTWNLLGGTTCMTCYSAPEAVPCFCDFCVMFQ